MSVVSELERGRENEVRRKMMREGGEGRGMERREEWGRGRRVRCCEIYTDNA